jgi:hypothetical protein
MAERLRSNGLIAAAALHLQGTTRLVGPDLAAATITPIEFKSRVHSSNSR